MLRKLLLVLLLLALLAAGALGVLVLKLREKPGDRLDTRLEGVSLVKPTHPATTRAAPPTKRKPRRHLASDRLCWPNFGGNAERSLARPNVDLGRPTRHFWVKGVGSYIEYPPSYCDGVLYVNSFAGWTYALNAHNGHVIWRRKGGKKPSTPAIAGSRLIVSSVDGTVTAYDRQNGRELWQLRTRGKVESSPLAIGNVVYFGATDGRLFAVYVRTGRIKWAYDTGGRINASPSVNKGRVCITTYAGSIFCLSARNGHKIWRRYIRRNFALYESFYASPSQDGYGLYTISRSGKVVALRASNGHLLWTHNLNTTGYSTPAVAHGRVFVGDFHGTLHAYAAASGRELWRRRVGGRILGGAVVVGNLVFFSTLEQRTYAARVSDGRIVWRIHLGKYSPGIATERHYFFTLNGLVMAFDGIRSPQVLAKKRAAAQARRDALALAKAKAKADAKAKAKQHRKKKRKP